MRRQLWPARVDDIDGEVAIVTGASRGLGLLIAAELARHGARLVLCARHGEELAAAADQLRADGAQVVAVPCDLTDEQAPQQLIDAAVGRFGRVDILVNNAGIISVGPVESTDVTHYEAALATMALGPIRLTLAALPVMRRQGHGRIVTVTSVGGKVSVPHLLPYSVAKFAAVAFSEGLAAELGRGPVTVTTVVPGLMRTGSHLRAEFTGQRSAEFTWFSLGASLPLVSMDAERAAARIVTAMRRGQAEVILTPLAQLASRGSTVSPALTTALLRLMNQLLPGPDGGEAARQPQPGAAQRPAGSQRVFDLVTGLGRRAAERFNQLGPGGRGQHRAPRPV